MTTFYMCRHGQTENNKLGRLSGWLDTPLTDVGVQNTASSAAKLKGLHFDKVMSSDLGRAFITAYLILDHLDYSAKIERVRGLREVNYGDIGNTPAVGPNSRYPQITPEENTDYVPPNGESLAQMQQRVLACIDKISRDNPDKTILIVSHDGAIKAVYAEFTKTPIGIVDSVSENPNDFVAKVVYDNGAIVSYDEVKLKV